jgi:hypothetical protein
LAHERWQGHADRLAHEACATWRFGAQHEALGALLDGHLLDAVEVAQDVTPLEVGAGEPLVELLAQHQGKEGAEQVAGDGCIGLVEDRPCVEDRLGGSKNLLDAPEFAVGISSASCVSIG